MARPNSSLLTVETGRAQTAAAGLLALLALLQIFLLARSIWAPPAAAAPSSAPARAPFESPPARLSAPPLPGQLDGETFTAQPWPAAGARTPPSPGMLAGEEAVAPPPAPLDGPAASSQTTAMPAVDPEVVEMLETVAELRASGQTEDALALLRASEGMDQNHPAVLNELALLHEQLGIDDRARAYWQRIEMLGPEAGGAYFATARARLGRTGGIAVSSPPAATPVFPLVEGPAGTVQAAPGAVLGIGPCQVVRDLAGSGGGDRRVLRIPILRLGSEPIDPNEVNVDVFFYDLVNGSKVEPTKADPPMFNWMAMPVDWSGLGAEPLDVVYHLPRLSMEEQVRHGQREYHGYIVKLYYRNRLQATAAEPEDMLEEASMPEENAPSAAAP